MLEPVSASQSRFVTPGLSRDARGVALGRQVAVLLPSIDRVVGLFRGLSERTSLDDLLPSLQIIDVVTPLKSRELIVLLPVQSSHVADGIRAVATLMGGLTFTGSAKHFVKLRDLRAPLGYDVDSLRPDRADYILYASEFTQSYHRHSEVSFGDLVRGLSLLQDPRDHLAEEERVLIRVAAGLWRTVTAYLHRNHLPCEVAACAAQNGGDMFYLVRTQLAPRMAGLFRSTPGIEVHRLVTDRVAVQVGFRHPIELGSCSSIFDIDTFHIFSGQRDCLETVPGDLTFVSAWSLVQVTPGPRTSTVLQPRAAPSVEIPLRLVIAPEIRPPVRAARIPSDQGPWLKMLVYLLPPQLMESTSVCQAGSDIFIYSQSPLELLPLGTLFYQAAAGILVPVGYELAPRIPPGVLAQHLNTKGEHLIFFCPDGMLQVRLSDFTMLSRQTLARVQVQPVTVQHAEPAAAPTPALVNDPVGLFPLWGFSAQTKET